MSEAGLGAHFELGPVSLAAMAGLTSATQQLAKAQSDWIEQEKEYQRLGPVFVQMLASGTVDSEFRPFDHGSRRAGRGPCLRGPTAHSRRSPLVDNGRRDRPDPRTAKLASS